LTGVNEYFCSCLAAVSESQDRFFLLPWRRNDSLESTQFSRLAASVSFLSCSSPEFRSPARPTTIRSLQQRNASSPTQQTHPHSCYAPARSTTLLIRTPQDQALRFDLNALSPYLNFSSRRRHIFPGSLAKCPLLFPLALSSLRRARATIPNPRRGTCSPSSSPSLFTASPARKSPRTHRAHQFTFLNSMGCYTPQQTQYRRNCLRGTLPCPRCC